jgi:flagellar protein FliS
MNPSMAYLSQQLASLSPARRVAMLYDKAIASLREAIQAIEAGDIQRRWNANNLAGQIIETLWATLDTERGGEIAANLDRLYSFMLRHLAEVDMKNNPKPAQDVIDLLEPLRQSWHELARQNDAETRPAPRPAAPAGKPAAPGETIGKITLSA